MREIKFRAWDKRLNKMYKVLSIKFDEPEWIYCENSLFERFSLKPNEVELMHLTGLKDKNGKEIYEGDIVKDSIRNYEIRWNSIDGKWFGHWLDKYGNSFFLEGEYFKLYKKIGNIYENPELLGKENVN
jgi:uncharacterized phage protein (TIGR01671 family)